MQKYKKTGFSLIELAVVILIIAFLISSISIAYSMIKQTSLRSIITEANTFTEAINLFEQKYKSLPGDFPYASVQWGAACDSTPSNCNGNGNGVIEYSYTTRTQNEGLRAWQHLSLAGMIIGNYTGVTDMEGGTYIGVNAPISQYNKKGWSILSDVPYDPPNSPGQYLNIGGPRLGFPPDDSILPTIDAYSIDNKIDDGYPRNGLVWGASIYGFPGGCYFPNTLTAPYTTDAANGMCILQFIFRKK
ncbi:prepilin-type N-terminal cleavage/methylation domain-containing protein [endosymbiont of Acanthamoeba sp. UWC8]|uniref:type II secretion system protein n=1 Tax=endosymbiont of Acanthamoeba sp. UWC8 TaxID=86106 RepID=UPI0004D0CA55|nr:prepilin-type N-terminal cleavage/methylation domain-containing protein [endosymbiont of Acanthamoeba sp. UWC8]AIF81602.1 prepilin-type N-terminal cleavage/methylation domain-containing protein [endosymbiont of Acanthamoeba sp. UWC8]